MATNSRSRIITILTGLAVIAIVVLIINGLLPYLRGPRIENINLESVQYSDEYRFSIEGTTINTETMTINKVMVPIDQDGNFTHDIALSPGRTVIELELYGNFENTKVHEYHIISPRSEEIYPVRYNKAMEMLEGQQEENPEEQEQNIITPLTTSQDA